MRQTREGFLFFLFHSQFLLIFVMYNTEPLIHVLKMTTVDKRYTAGFVVYHINYGSVCTHTHSIPMRNPRLQWQTELN